MWKMLNLGLGAEKRPLIQPEGEVHDAIPSNASGDAQLGSARQTFLDEERRRGGKREVARAVAVACIVALVCSAVAVASARQQGHAKLGSSELGSRPVGPLGQTTLS